MQPARIARQSGIPPPAVVDAPIRKTATGAGARTVYRHIPAWRISSPPPTTIEESGGSPRSDTLPSPRRD